MTELALFIGLGNRPAPMGNVLAGRMLRGTPPPAILENVIMDEIGDYMTDEFGENILDETT